MMSLDRDSAAQQAVESHIWSDLRAIRCINQLQLEVQELKVANSRLKVVLALGAIFFSCSLIALAFFQVITYKKLPEKLPSTSISDPVILPEQL